MIFSTPTSPFSIHQLIFMMMIFCTSLSHEFINNLICIYLSPRSSSLPLDSQALLLPINKLWWKGTRRAFAWFSMVMGIRKKVRSVQLEVLCSSRGWCTKEKITKSALNSIMLLSIACRSWRRVRKNSKANLVTIFFHYNIHINSKARKFSEKKNVHGRICG